jgi:hypothetical protein
MKTILITALVTVAVLAGGCADDLQKMAAASAALEAKPKAEVKEPKMDVAEIGRAATCTWAKAAGIPDLKVGVFDAGDTKRQIAALHGAYKTTCPPAQAPVAAVPVATPPAAPPVAKKN